MPNIHRESGLEPRPLPICWSSHRDVFYFCTNPVIVDESSSGQGCREGQHHPPLEATLWSNLSQDSPGMFRLASGSIFQLQLPWVGLGHKRTPRTRGRLTSQQMPKSRNLFRTFSWFCPFRHLSHSCHKKRRTWSFRTHLWESR